MDTLNFNASGNPADMTYNFLINYFFNYSIFIVAFMSMFILEAIKYFSEDYPNNWTLNKKYYGIVTFIVIALLDLLLNGYTYEIKQIALRLLIRVTPIFVIYNIFLKQLFEAIRKKLASKISEWSEIK